MKRDELEPVVKALHELGVSYEEGIKLMGDTTKDLKGLKSLWGKPSVGTRKDSRLIKIGVSLIAFPIPTIGIKKSLGSILIVAGLMQQRMKHVHVADVYSVFQDVNKKLQSIWQKTV